MAICTIIRTEKRINLRKQNKKRRRRILTISYKMIHLVSCLNEKSFRVARKGRRLKEEVVGAAQKEREIFF